MGLNDLIQVNLGCPRLSEINREKIQKMTLQKIFYMLPTLSAKEVSWCFYQMNKYPVIFLRGFQVLPCSNNKPPMSCTINILQS